MNFEIVRRENTLILKLQFKVGIKFYTNSLTSQILSNAFENDRSVRKLYLYSDFSEKHRYTDPPLRSIPPKYVEIHFKQAADLSLINLSALELSRGPDLITMPGHTAIAVTYAPQVWESITSTEDGRTTIHTTELYRSIQFHVWSVHQFSFNIPSRRLWTHISPSFPLQKSGGIRHIAAHGPADAVAYGKMGFQAALRITIHMV